MVFPVGHLLRSIPRLNPTPGEDIDQLRRQGRALASSFILHVRSEHSGCQGAFWLDSGMLCSLERLVSPSFPRVPEFHVRQVYPCALGIYLATK